MHGFMIIKRKRRFEIVYGVVESDTDTVKQVLLVISAVPRLTDTYRR
jgi:hypothetical protein